MAAQTLKAVTSYYRGLLYFQRGGRLKDCPLGGTTAHHVHLYSLGKTLQLWDTPHYRDVNFHTDIRKNLKNVGIPATGMPLSTFCHFKATAYLFLLLVYPMAAACAALYCKLRYGAHFAEEFEQQLLDPQHWFAIWRLNCLVVAWHSYITQSPEYNMEDKGTFLLEGDKAGIPVSPFLKLGSLVVKHKSIEGGMGLHFFENFAKGGDWILQERMTNSSFIASLLPQDAPLSTLRVITGSRQWLMQQGAGQQGTAGSTAGGVQVMTVVFRAGLAGASTDHTSICFDVDRTSGVIGKGISNQHWYKLGLQHVGRVDASASTTYTHHPDTNKAITGAGRLSRQLGAQSVHVGVGHALTRWFCPMPGEQIPDFSKMLQLMCDSHLRLVPEVPLVGWDVALTPQGVSLLEINISCNFFNGSYSRQGYIDFIRDYLVALELQEKPTCVTSSQKHKQA